MKRMTVALIPAPVAGVARPCASAGYAWHLSSVESMKKRTADFANTQPSRLLRRQPT